MNFNKIFEMQKELDKTIEKRHNIDPKKYINEKIVALIVEVSEFANEYAPFKYWKTNKKIDRNKLVEEFVDGIHFIVSLGYQVEANTNVVAKVVDQDLTKQLLATYNSLSKLTEQFNKTNLDEAFSIYMGNAALLKITDDEIMEHYLNKNKVNFDRITNNY